MKKSELRKIIREEVLKESMGYIEAMGPDFDTAVITLEDVFKKWSRGPATTSADIAPAKKELKDYFNKLIDNYIVNKDWYNESDDDGWANNDIVKMFSDNPNINEYYVIQYSIDNRNWKDTSKISTDKEMLEKLMKKMSSRLPQYQFKIDVRKN